jgi:lipopolysaccharide/colanic/teichoic acid biosynthesis glycosyltransferase
MIKNADAMKEELFDRNESDGALFKMKHDPRMTKVGKIIRKFSIDELPQLVNVIKGEMSIVGPRPLPVEDLEKLDESKEFWSSIKDREKIKPGITGLWQISGRSNLGFREMICLDMYYIENQSLLFDLEIMFATVPVVIFGKGAY